MATHPHGSSPNALATVAEAHSTLHGPIIIGNSHAAGIEWYALISKLWKHLCSPGRRV